MSRKIEPKAAPKKKPSGKLEDAELKQVSGGGGDVQNVDLVQVDDLSLSGFRHKR